MEEHPRSRIGNFFIMIGLFLIVLFIASIIGKGENRSVFFILGAITLALGYLFKRRPHSEEPGTRFSGVRKMRENQKKRIQAREEKNKQKKKP